MAAAFFSQYSFYHFGCIFRRNSAFIFDFVKISRGLCSTKKLLPCVSSDKKGLKVLKSTFVTFKTFFCWTGFIFGSGLFLVSIGVFVLFKLVVVFGFYCFFGGFVVVVFKKTQKT